MSGAVSSCGFAQAMMSRIEIVPFVTVNVVGKHDGPQAPSLSELNKRHLEVLSELTHLYNYGLLGNPVKRGNRAPNVKGLGRKMRKVHHLMRFVENKIFRVLSKRREYVLRIVGSLIEYLRECPPTPSRIYARVEMDKIQKEVEFVPPKVERLEKLFEAYMAAVKKKQKSMENRDRVKKKLKKTLETMGKHSEQLRFFPIHPMQQKFEKLFFADVLPFKTQMDGIMTLFTPPTVKEFTSQFAVFVRDCLVSLKLSKKPYNLLLPLTLLRYAFDATYGTNTFYVIDNSPNKYSNITFSQFSPPASFCAPYNPNTSTKVRDYFCCDPYYRKAVDALEQLQFHTNPFDILACADAAISEIEAGASHYSQNTPSMFPFEVTFELLLGIIISSQTPDIGAVAALLDRISPLTDLCPYFEHPKALLIACSLHLSQMTSPIS